jgi:MOSC domain-containing protein YiiM|uniref:MOSC domain-containing protein n=1 Tax=Desulfobacca acetoxidans TaxID=60893 RepID=A0A7C3WH07_9BACT
MTKPARYPANQARVVAVSVSDKKGVAKHNVPEARLLVEHGLEGDAHAGGGRRQVSLLALESIEKMRAAGAEVKPGDFAENITTLGIPVHALPLGTRLRIGPEAELVVTQIGKACHRGCTIRDLVGDCIMPREGIFARVVKGGRIKPGDTVEVLSVPGGDPDSQ